MKKQEVIDWAKLNGYSTDTYGHLVKEVPGTTMSLEKGQEVWTTNPREKVVIDGFGIIPGWVSVVRLSDNIGYDVPVGEITQNQSDSKKYRLKVSQSAVRLEIRGNGCWIRLRSNYLKNLTLENGEIKGLLVAGCQVKDQGTAKNGSGGHGCQESRT